MKKKINNYRFQQQQQAKQEYQKLKKVKEIIKETPEDATEELEYVKKLLSGEDVGDFVSKEPVLVETENWGWMSTGSAMTGPQVQAQLSELMQDLELSKLSLSEFLDFTTPIKTKGLWHHKKLNKK